MDPNSSLERICLGENIVEISSDKVEGSGDCDSPEYQDTANSGGKKEIKAMVFHKMDTEEFSDRFMAPCFVNGLEAYDGEINLREEAIKKVKGKALKEKYDPEAFIFPIRLEGQVNKNALADTGSDINTMPYRIYETLGREEMKKVDRGIMMINHTQVEAMRILTNVLCQVGVTTLIAKFLILDIPIDCDAPIVVVQGFMYTIGGIVNTSEKPFLTFDGICHQTFRAARSDVLRTAESDSDDEEEYEIKRNKFGALIYGPKPALYLNCNDLTNRSLALQAVINPFQKISVWKKVVSFLGSLLVPLKQVNWKPDYKTMGGNDDETGPSRSKRSRQFETMEEVLLLQVHHEFLIWEGCNRYAKSRLGLYHADELDEEGFNPNFEADSEDDHLWIVSENDQLGVPRVSIPRPSRASMQDLYDRMGSMKIRQDAIEKMEYKQSYHWDRYQGVFKHMAEVYNIPLQGAYNLHG
nr:hypothetical protein [Tanacetum cinerariifolium]